MADNEKVEQAVQAKKDKKDKKPDKNAKPGFFARVGKYFREMKSELKRSSGPPASRPLTTP